MQTDKEQAKTIAIISGCVAGFIFIFVLVVSTMVYVTEHMDNYVKAYQTSVKY